MGIIHIYSNYPDYDWIGDEDEGIACVDDAARAAVFYMKYFNSYQDSNSYNKAKKLIEFILYLQAENGYFYNFIYDDYSINKTFRTSIAEPNWWTWRAAWTLSVAQKFFKSTDNKFTIRIANALEKTISVIKKYLPKSKNIKNVHGINHPTWLPYESASDQAALIIMLLTNYYNLAGDAEVLQYIEDLCEGLIMNQVGDAENFPYGAFLSWENLWHGYGNLQSYALLKSYEIIKNEKYLQAALFEIDHFYKYLIDEQYISNFHITGSDDKLNLVEIQKYSQIAYIFRPMVYACLKAYEITEDSLYAISAGEIAGWFWGNNSAGEQMYNPDDGKCFDGINDEKNINMNSGAESTIEALLTILAVEKNDIAKNILNKNVLQLNKQ
jgi:hypothetical protein